MTSAYRFFKSHNLLQNLYYSILLWALCLSGCKDGVPTFKSESHLLTPQAQAAVNLAMDSAAHHFHFAKGYSATVEGVQEDLPSNSAIADLTFNAHFPCDPGFGLGRQKWIRGQGIFKRYSDGRWVLTALNPTQFENQMNCLAMWQGTVPVPAN